MDVEISEARADVPTQDIARLIWSTDTPLMRRLFGTFDIWETVVRHEWPREVALICHANAILAQQGDRSVGLILGFPAARAAACYDASGGLQRQHLGPAQLAAFERGFAEMERLFPDPAADAFHVMELAVAPEARGAGLAHRLLEAGTARARQMGCNRLCLDVAASNPAVGLYRSLGFTVAVETRIPELERTHGVGLHYHMEGPPFG